MKTLKVHVEVSARHVHLRDEDAAVLFGEDFDLSSGKIVSSGNIPEERVTIIGTKRNFGHVAIIGPGRSYSQVEISATDARLLGLDAPLRLSGDIEGTPGVTLQAENGNILNLEKGLIIAKRHVHMTDEGAAVLGVKTGDVVKLRIDTGRGRATIYDDLLCRVDNLFAECTVHLDTDEGNAAFTGKSCEGTLIAE
jgi:putative phosphotransacetylase